MLAFSVLDKLGLYVISMSVSEESTRQEPYAEVCIQSSLGETHLCLCYALASRRSLLQEVLTSCELCQRIKRGS